MNRALRLLSAFALLLGLLLAAPGLLFLLAASQFESMRADRDLIARARALDPESR